MRLILRLAVFVILIEWGVFVSLFFIRVLVVFLSLNFMGVWVSELICYDVYSILLIWLRLWIIGLINLASCFYKNFSNKWNLFILSSFRLLFILILCFSFNSLFLFYIRFEFVVIPTFILILGWGYRVERLQAGIFMFLYTVISSLPLLLAMIFLFNSCFTLTPFLKYYIGERGLRFFWWFYMIIVFIVKLPIYLVHLWLPKAHVEAPLAGSMILAGVLLKLGGYGVMKSFFFINWDFLMSKGLILSLSLLGVLIISFSCLIQSDLKSLIAYSSVVHIGPVLLGLIRGTWLGLFSSFLMIIAHGICSSGLFYALNLFYERWSRRSVIVMKGGLICSPIFSFWWFRLCAGNIGFPPSLNFVSEVFLCLVLIGQNFFVMIFLGGVLLLSGVYRVYLYISLTHGMDLKLISFINSPIRELLIFFFS